MQKKLRKRISSFFQTPTKTLTEVLAENAKKLEEEKKRKDQARAKQRAERLEQARKAQEEADRLSAEAKAAEEAEAEEVKIVNCCFVCDTCLTNKL